MSSTKTSLSQTSSASELLKNAAPCGFSVKAERDPHTPACDMRTHAAEVLGRTHKQEVAARLIGISQSRVSHKFSEGTVTIKELEALGVDYMVGLANQILDVYGPLASSPAARLRQIAKDARALLEEIDQISAHIEDVR